MFKALMAVQWKWTRGAALVATLIGFTIPIASVQRLRGFGADFQRDAAAVVDIMQSFGIGYALLAAASGLVFALVAWTHDHRGRHVYALSLPVTRARYAAMRFGAGVAFLLLPAMGVLIGSLLAILITPIPPGLHTYPFALTLRFFFASCVAFAIFFAISSSTAKAAGIILGSIAVVVLAAFIVSAADVTFNVLGYASSFLFVQPGLLSVFTGRWMLFDV